jgi:cell division transport system ATP-binding protein
MAMGRKKKSKGSDPAPAPRNRKGGAPIIELRDVTTVYPGGHMALDRVSLAVDRGEFVFLVGPTGCGKSTLIKMLIRELGVTDGSVRIAGRDIGAMPEKKIPHLRRNIGTVFQDFKLLPDRTVYDNVAYALQVIGAPRSEIRRQVPDPIQTLSKRDRLSPNDHQKKWSCSLRLSRSRSSARLRIAACSFGALARRCKPSRRRWVDW